jgi:hypothetical protein
MLIKKMHLIHNVLFLKHENALLLEDGKDTVTERFVLMHEEDYREELGEMSADDVIGLFSTYEAANKEASYS